MSPITLSVSSQNGDKWCLSCGVLRGHLLFISMMGRMPWLIKKNYGCPQPIHSLLSAQPHSPSPLVGVTSPLKVSRAQESRDNDHHSFPLTLKKSSIPAEIYGMSQPKLVTSSKSRASGWRDINQVLPFVHWRNLETQLAKCFLPCDLAGMERQPL